MMKCAYLTGKGSIWGQKTIETFIMKQVHTHVSSVAHSLFTKLSIDLLLKSASFIYRTVFVLSFFIACQYDTT